MYTLVRYDGTAAVLRSQQTNAVLRFVAEDASLTKVALGTTVDVEALFFDSARKAVVCRAGAGEGAGEGASKRARLA
jgi:hypothetical protein